MVLVGWCRTCSRSPRTVQGRARGTASCGFLRRKRPCNCSRETNRRRSRPGTRDRYMRPARSPRARIRTPTHCRRTQPRCPRCSADAARHPRTSCKNPARRVTSAWSSESGCGAVLPNSSRGKRVDLSGLLSKNGTQGEGRAPGAATPRAPMPHAVNRARAVVARLGLLSAGPVGAVRTAVVRRHRHGVRAASRAAAARGRAVRPVVPTADAVDRRLRLWLRWAGRRAHAVRGAATPCACDFRPGWCQHDDIPI